MRHLVRLEELSLFLLSIFLFARLEFHWWWLPALLLAPDIGMLGYLANPRVGAVTYNLVHHRAVAVGLYLLGILMGSPILQLIGLVILAHSSMDRMLGYGLKYPDSFQHTHLGMIGAASIRGWWTGRAAELAVVRWRNGERAVGAPEHFEIAGRRGLFRPIASVSLDDAVDMVTAAIVFARTHGVTELLVNVTSLTGFEPPGLGDRYFLVEKWAIAAAGTICLALVARHEMIDPEKFGVTVAANRGLVGDVFVSEAEAVAWLDSRLSFSKGNI